MEPLFTSDCVPDNLYLDEDGTFYFLWWEKLLRYDPAANEVDEVYAAKGKIDSFQFYDGKLYVLENYAGTPTIRINGVTASGISKTASSGI